MSRRCWPFKTSTRKLRCSHTLLKPKSLEGCLHEYHPPMAERSLFPEWSYSARLVGDAERAQVRHVSLAGRSQRGYYKATREVNDRTHDKGHSLTICLSDLSGSDQPFPSTHQTSSVPRCLSPGLSFSGTGFGRRTLGASDQPDLTNRSHSIKHCFSDRDARPSQALMRCAPTSVE